MAIILYPYKLASGGVKALQSSLRTKQQRVFRVTGDGGYRSERYPRNLVINWGNSQPPNTWNWQQGNVKFLNNPRAVATASDKLLTFNVLQDADIPIPAFVVARAGAELCIEAGETILCRTKLRGHSGDGIVIAKTVAELVRAPLYVVYKKKKNEFRVHVFNNEVVDVQEKRRDSEITDRTEEQALIRSHHHGWVFCREIEFEETKMTRLKDLAKLVINTLNLDFGAVDIIYNEREDKFYVLEVNTAVGLSGTTLDIYTDAILRYKERH